MKYRRSLAVGKRTLLAKTCSGCDKFKDGSKFRKTKDGYHQPYCDVCMSHHSNLCNQKANEEAIRNGTKYYDPWTDADLKKLEEMVQQKLPYKVMAETLGRSIRAVTNTRRRYGI